MLARSWVMASRVRLNLSVPMRPIRSSSQSRSMALEIWRSASVVSAMAVLSLEKKRKEPFRALPSIEDLFGGDSSLVLFKLLQLSLFEFELQLQIRERI